MEQIHNLSERECEILRLIATGVGNKEIARKLQISTNTVKVHIRNIFRKIEVNSRTEAAMYAINHGIASSNSESISGTALDSFPSDRTINEDGSYEIEKIQGMRYFLEKRTGLILVLLFFLIPISIILLYVTFRSLFNEEAGISQQVTEPQRWYFITPMPTRRYSLALTEYQDLIYAIGGENGEEVLDQVERYDVTANNWSDVTDKPTAVSEIKAAVIDGKIFVPGGKLNSGQVTDVLEIYDPKLDQWSQGAPLPIKLSAYALTGFDGKLYLFGGWDGQNFVNSVLEYVPINNQWNKIETMPTKRGFACAVVVGRKIYVIGGFDGEKALSVNEVLLPDDSRILSSIWTTETPIPRGIYAMGAANLAEIIYIIGGNDDKGELSSVLAYIPRDKEWHLADTIPSLPRSNLGMVGVGTYLYAIGGELDEKPSEIDISYKALFTAAMPFILK